MLKEYKTILNYCSIEIEEKKSRFIATAGHVSNEDEARAFIDGLKAKYRDASHNVYCYSIGLDNMIQRYSDDGEPSGTAGIPVLEVIKRMDIRELAVVVTRYFGGTLLGAAGLIRAYGKSAALAIESAGVVRKLLCSEIGITVEYALLGKVKNFMITGGYKIKDIIFKQDAEIMVYVPADQEDIFTKSLCETTNAGINVKEYGNSYIMIDDRKDA